MIQTYKDRNKQWRWRVRAKNGRILADSAEGYKRRRDCDRGLLLVGRLICRGILGK